MGFNPFAALSLGEGKLLRGATGALNKVGIQTPNFGLSTNLINQGNSWNGQTPQFNAVAPYGAHPTAQQSQDILSNPQLSSPNATTHADIPAVTAGPTNPFTTPTTPSTPASGPGSSSYYLHNTTINGQTYNLADPAQMEAARQAQLQNLGGSRDTAIRQLQQGIQNNLQGATLTHGQALGTYNQNATDFGRTLANNVVDLGQNYDLGQVNNQQHFAGLSPNAFQSSQATSQQYGTDQYNKGLTTLKQQGDENVGSNYLTTGQIDPNSAIGKMIEAEKNSYNVFTTGQNQGLQNGIQQANVAYQGGADQINTNLQNLAAYGGTQSPTYNPVNYNYSGPSASSLGSYQAPSGNPYTAPQTDISQYTPYTSSSQLAQSPQAQSPSPATWTGSSNPFAGLLGYNPNATQSNYLNAFANRAPATASGS